MFCASVCVAAALEPHTVTTSQQGIHKWKVAGGTLIGIAGTEADTVTYRRSFSFYFQEKDDAELMHVPIVGGRDDYAMTWYTAGQGDNTDEDAVAVLNNGKLHLIIVARQKSGNALKLTKYLLVHDDPDFPDGPSSVFKKISTQSRPIKQSQDVDAALLRQLANM